MSKKSVFAIITVLVLSAISVNAQVIPEKLTQTIHCGDGVREGYELCEPDTDQDFCPEIGEMVGIAMVCNELRCNCLPKTKDCGNQIREGSEMCDPGEKEAPVDFCPQVSEMIGLPLECNTATCDCEPAGVPYVISKCGDNVIEGSEQCEADVDCAKGRHCDNCTCVKEEKEINLNLTPAKHNVTPEPPEIPSVEDIVTKKDKNVVAGIVIDDLVGIILPEELSKYNKKRMNVHVTLKNNTNRTVGVVTAMGVVQEAHPVPINKSQLNVYVTEEQVQKILDADDPALKISLLLETKEIIAKPTGIFGRFWYWLTHLFT